MAEDKKTKQELEVQAKIANDFKLARNEADKAASDSQASAAASSFLRHLDLIPRRSRPPLCADLHDRPLKIIPSYASSHSFQTVLPDFLPLTFLLLSQFIHYYTFRFKKKKAVRFLHGQP